MIHKRNRDKTRCPRQFSYILRPPRPPRPPTKHLTPPPRSSWSHWLDHHQYEGVNMKPGLWKWCYSRLLHQFPYDIHIFHLQIIYSRSELRWLIIIEEASQHITICAFLFVFLRDRGFNVNVKEYIWLRWPCRKSPPFFVFINTKRASVAVFVLHFKMCITSVVWGREECPHKTATNLWCKWTSLKLTTFGL